MKTSQALQIASQVVMNLMVELEQMIVNTSYFFGPDKLIVSFEVEIGSPGQLKYVESVARLAVQDQIKDVAEWTDIDDKRVDGPPHDEMRPQYIWTENQTEERKYTYQFYLVLEISDSAKMIVDTAKRLNRLKIKI